jgi:prepilin-type N-terminal cleavage/methylation domain-containing protein
MSIQKGFTLAELLTVILLVSLLISIVIPSYLNQKRKAREAQALTQMRSLATFVGERGAINGVYPPDVPRNTPPSGLEGEWAAAVRNLPEGAGNLDYENWLDGCIVRFTWFGENGVKDSQPDRREVRGDDRKIEIYTCDSIR